MRDYNAILDRVRSELTELGKMIKNLESLESRLTIAVRVLNRFKSMDNDKDVSISIGENSVLIGPTSIEAIRPVLIENQAKNCEKIVLDLEKVSLGITGIDVTQSQTRVLEI